MRMREEEEGKRGGRENNNELVTRERVGRVACECQGRRRHQEDERGGEKGSGVGKRKERFESRSCDGQLKNSLFFSPLEINLSHSD